jgi:hypothetical protein
MSEIRDGIRRLVGQRRLSETQLQRLEALQAELAPPTSRDEAAPPQAAQRMPAPGGAAGPSRRRRPPSPRRRTILGAVAAGLLLAVAPAAYFIIGPGALDPAERIAGELAANHLQLKPLEVNSPAMEDARAHFEKLDFELIDSGLPALADLDLSGGRYCSVQGAPAAQLHLASQGGGRLYTLYQAQYDPDRFGPLPRPERGEAPLQLQAHGLSVQLWVEQGILLALVGEKRLAR